jgi:putative endonuclease
LALEKLVSLMKPVLKVPKAFLPNPMPWFLYVVKCRDESLYTGITTDISRRISEHNSKKGAFYTQNKTPVELVYQEAMANQSQARKREAAIKRLTRAEKIELISSPRPISSAKISR